MINFEPFQIINLLNQAKSLSQRPRPGRFVFKWYELDETSWEPGKLLCRIKDASIEQTSEQTWFTEYELLHSPYGRVSGTPHPSGKYLEVWKFPDYLKAV